jgi:tRNA-splicing endonuclease subunit Sen54
MGKMSTGIKNPALWLLPEEALFMVERGNLDLWWPSRSSFEGIMRSKRDEDDEEEEKSKGTPMSLQAAYAMFIGNDGEQGKVSLERYTVYAHLKRNGWVALRAPDWNPDRPGLERRNQNIISPHEPRSIFTWLFGRFFAEKDIKHPAYGPLVRPGMHRSYNTIYRQVAIIPRHKPSSIAAAPAPAREDPYRVIFHLWKPTTIANFTKSNPGIPDYRVAVVDARSNPIPTLSQITSLLESTPWDPPQSELEGPGDKKLYGRLRHGWRNVILAVIDEGVISYVELGEAAFGEERLYENFDRGNLGGSKRGGRGGRGRGKGRGRARGRG